ncbi:Bifunctional bis(5'-adenosyl)-triphosphatase/adenylylsulfatase FHIT [Glycine soja]
MKRKMAIQGSAMKRKQKENERAKQSARKPWTTYKYTRTLNKYSSKCKQCCFPALARRFPIGFCHSLQHSYEFDQSGPPSIKMAAEGYTFGPYKIHHTEVFYSTNLSYAMVNLRPLLPGNNKSYPLHGFHFVAHCFGWKINYKQKHSCVEFCCILILHYITYIYKGHVVQHNMFWGFLSFTAMDFLIILVLGTRFFYPVQCKVVSLIAYGNFLHVLICSKREVKRFVDLTADETSDLWLTAQKVGKQLESYHKASSLTLAIQDGPQAGQMVPHVHIHLIPRKSGDFEKNDEIYDAIDEKEKELKQKLDLDKERKDRSLEDMSQEADEYRKLFL